MTLGERIRFYRNKKNLTQKQLSSLIGKKEITVRKYENGKINISVEMLEKIATALDVAVSDLHKDAEEISQVETELKSITQRDNLDDYLKTLGYDIAHVENENFSFIFSDDGDFKISVCDLEEFYKDISKFAKFQMQQLLNKAIDQA